MQRRLSASPQVFILTELRLTLDFFLAGVFLISAVGKLRRLDSFLLTVRRFVGSPKSSRAIAWAVPVLELFVSGGLLIRPCETVAAFGALVLCTAFCVVSVRALTSNIHVPCMCFGPGEDEVGYSTLARSIVLSVGAGMLIYARVSAPTLGRLDTLMIATSALTALGILILGRLILVWPEIAAIKRKRAGA